MDCLRNMARPNLFVAAPRIEACAERVFGWHREPGALQRLTPPWARIETTKRAPGIRSGDSGAMWVYLGLFRTRWSFEHRDYIEGRQFCDVQTSGPFRRWEHTHLIIAEGLVTCRLEDRIEYELPFGASGNFLGGWLVRRKLARVLAYQHRVTAEAMRASTAGHARDSGGVSDL
jgi:ligand-binding SRPBCC domain-containing protein